MRYFDLHCDTMTECAVKDIPLRENTLHVSLEQVKDWEHYVQCYAVWLPDDLRGEAAWQRFLQVAERFAREVGENAGSLEQLRGPGDLDRLERQGRHGAILTVESGAVLGGKLERVQECKRLGVGMCTLTWNGATELGRGVMAPGSTGLTEFGRQAVKAMEKAGIPLIEAEKTVIAEDFSEYEVRHPGVFGWLGLGDVPSLHNNKFDFDEEVMQTGINAFIGLLDYFEEK